MRLYPKAKLTIALAVVILQTFFYVNAPAIFGEYAGQVRNMMLLYMIMTFAFSFATQYIPQDLRQDIFEGLRNFVISFFITAGVLYYMPNRIGGLKLFSLFPTVKIAIPLMLVFAFVISYTEELIFRGVLPYFLGDPISNVLFGLYHFWVYGGNITTIVVAIIMGMVFSLIRDAFGLMGSVGSHTAWNLKVLHAY